MSGLYEIDRGAQFASPTFAQLSATARGELQRAFASEDDVGFVFNSVSDALWEYYELRRASIEAIDIPSEYAQDVNAVLRAGEKFLQTFESAAAQTKLVLDSSMFPPTEKRLVEIVAELRCRMDAISAVTSLKRPRGAPRKKDELYSALGDRLLKIWMLTSFQGNEFTETNRGSLKAFFEAVLKFTAFDCTVSLQMRDFGSVRSAPPVTVGFVELSSRKDAPLIVRSVQDAVRRRKQALLVAKK